MLKERWQGLQKREQLLVRSGAIVALILAFYVWVWLPLDSTVTALHTSLLQKQQDLRWMNSAAKRMIALQRDGYAINLSNSPLLDSINDSLQTQRLTYYLKQTPMPQEESVQVIFVGVPFDSLMQWMRELWLQNGIVASHFKAVRAPISGTVNAEITLVNV